MRNASIFLVRLVLLAVLFVPLLADQDAEGQQTEAEAAVEAEEGMFSTLDYVLMILIAIVGGYAVSYRYSDDAIPEYEIKPMQVRQESVTETGFIAKMRKRKSRLVVFYGSQTGTAEEFAGRIAKEGAKYGVKGLVADPEEEDMDQLQQLREYEEEIGESCLAVFMMATYGEGDPTDNAMDFNEKLEQRELDVQGLRYAVFGLGNKTYEHFNSMGKFVDKRLEELGGKRVHVVGLGDDDANLEDDFITWKEVFWTRVCEELDIEATGEDFNTRQYDHKVLEDGEYKPEKLYTGEVARLNSYITQRTPFDLKNPFMSPIKINRNIHKEGSGRHCMHIECDIEGARIRYEAGDHVAVYPTNNLQLVERLAQLLDINMDTAFIMKNLDEDSSKKHPFPCPTTYRTALTHYVDITALPRTHIIKELAKYANDEDRSQLEKMIETTPEGKALYQKWIIEDVRHLTHILEDLPSCKPPVDHLLELLPRLQPRFYSIASSPKVHPNSVHICGVVVEYTTPTGRTNKGVATTWLREKVPEGEECPKVPIYIRRSQFSLPNRSVCPIIMIGPGTGLAPFRGFIQERAWMKENGRTVGPTLLFFGCRNQASDYIYQEELEAYHADGLLDLRVAFSRDQAEKRYVTHLLRESGSYIWELLNQGSHLYVCGDAKMMAKDVRNIIREICQEYGSMEEGSAEAYVKKLETQRRYSADVWS